MARVTQKDIVLKHLRDFGSITSWEAFTEYGITRLSAVIYILRAEGYDIESETIKTLNRYGNPTRFSKYSLASN